MDRLPIIADLRETEQGVEIWCCNHACRHEVYLTVDEAEARLGAHRTFVEVARDLKCSKCGALGREGMVRIRGDIGDFYKHLLRKRWEREEALYGRRVTTRWEDGPYTLHRPTVEPGAGAG